MPIDYIGICLCCGFPITKYEIGADIRGTFTDYIENAMGEISVSICDDCWRKSKEMQDRGIEYAISVRNRLTRQDKEDRDSLTP